MNPQPTIQPEVTADLGQFVASLYGASQAPFRLIYGDTTVDVTDDLSPIQTAAGAVPLMLSMTTAQGGVPFLYATTDEPTDDAWEGMLSPDLEVYPTAILTKGCKVHAVYALSDEAAVDNEAVISLAAAMGAPLEDALPTPGADGWALVHFNADHHTALEDLQGAFGTVTAPAVVDRPAPPVSGLGRYKDATIRTVFDFEDPRLAEPITVATGLTVKDTNWEPLRTTRMGALDGFCTHRLSKKKDSAAMVLGKLPPPNYDDPRESNRRNSLIKEVWMVGLDFDTGVTGDELAQAMTDAGLMGVLASTYSHMTTTTTETYRSFALWMVETGRAASVEEAVVDRDVVRARMAAEPKKILPAIVDTMEIEIVTEDGSREVVITHTPLPKWRLILPLDRPFIPAEHDTADEEGFRVWRGVAPALARRLGGLPFDHACVDPARLWYLPNHPADRPDFRIDLFGGDLLNLDDILAEAAELAEADADEPATARTRKSTTASTGPFNERWIAREGAGFEIVKLLTEVVKPRQDPKLKLVRASRGKGRVTIRCPFADGHGKRDTNDSAGAFASAPDASLGENFTIYCNHGSCIAAKRDRLTYLNKMLGDGWFTEDEAHAYETIQHDDDDDVDVETALADYIGATSTESKTTIAQSPRKSGAVAVNGVLDGLDQWNPKKTLFTGPNAADEAIDALGKVASVVKMGNKMKVVIRGKDGLGFFSEAEARLFFKPYKAEIEVGLDKNGDPKMKDVLAIDLLLASERRVAWEGIDCDPSNSLPSHVLNTWSGIEIAPAPGDCNLLKAHIRNSLCSGDASYDHYLTQWFAHMVQKPTQKPGVAPVVIGPKGSGKSTVADFVRRAIGKKHSVKIAQAKHLVGNFNAHLAGMLFCQAEEVTFGKDRKSEGPLKDMITAKTMLAEKKGLDAYQETNFTRFFLVSNDGHVVHASDGERRWFVLRATDLFAGRPMNDPDRIAYFDALNAEADAGGIAAFLDYLLTYDLTGFTPFAAPDTDALTDQKEQGLSDDDQWVLGVLQTGAFDDKDGVELGETWELDEPLDIDQSVVRSSYASHVKRYGGSSGGANAALKALARHGDVKEVRKGARNARKRLYRFAPRQDWRDAFEKRFGIGFTAETDAGD